MGVFVGDKSDVDRSGDSKVGVLSPDGCVGLARSIERSGSEKPGGGSSPGGGRVAPLVDIGLGVVTILSLCNEGRVVDTRM